jgi:arginine-tRNA-protein transferase
MSHDQENITPATRLSFYASAAHDCSYLADKTAISVFADPNINMTNEIYAKLAEIGFRRSGMHVYTPQCEQCRSCIPVRVPVSAFQPNRNQRRTLSKNQNLQLRQYPAKFYPQHFQLYQRYLAERHLDGGMDDPTPDSYMTFLTSNWSHTQFYEFRLDDVPICISVVDQLPQALSAVYTFFDPDYSHLSLGSFAILRLIEEAKSLGHHWLYLGFWIEQSRKMNYKDNYRPIEALLNGEWHSFAADEPIQFVSD